MSDGISEMNKEKKKPIYIHTDGKVYDIVDATFNCEGCCFYRIYDYMCLVENTDADTLCNQADIIFKESPITTASADLAAKGTPLVANIRTFDTGATRDTDEGKHDIEAFFSPLVTKRRAEYMHIHRKQSDGTLRSGDNWQKGIPYQQSLKSLCRHIEDIKLLSRGYEAREDIETAICAAMFNLESMLLTRLEGK